MCMPYTWFIPGIYCQLADYMTYHLWPKPDKFVENSPNCRCFHSLTNFADVLYISHTFSSTSPKDEQKNGKFVDPNPLTLDICKVILLMEEILHQLAQVVSRISSINSMDILPKLCRTKPWHFGTPPIFSWVPFLWNLAKRLSPPEPAGVPGYLFNALDVRGNRLQKWPNHQL